MSARPLLTGVLALSLSLGTGSAGAAQAGPSERDVAYELGVQAETAGDDGRAAAAFERAFRLTSPAESGPRLLFLRASVAARLRADDGSPVGRVQLCSAQALLREYLGDAPAPAGQDPLAEERARLVEVDGRLALAGGADCATLLGTAAPTPGEPARDPVAPTDDPAAPPRTEPTQPTAPVVTPPADPSRAQAERRRTLRLAGGVGLGVGAVGLSVMIAGIAIAGRAEARGAAACREGTMACEAQGALLRDIGEDGRRGNTLLTIGAVAGGLATITGAVLLAVGERGRRPARVSLTPVWSPGWSGAALSGRF